MKLLWSFLPRSRAKRGKDDPTKPIQFTKKRTQSDGDVTEYEDWSDMDDSQSLELEVAPEEITRGRSSENNSANRIPLSRFSVFRKSESEPIYDDSDDLVYSARREHNEHVLTAQETGRRRNIARPSEPTTADEVKGNDLKNILLVDQAHTTREQPTLHRDGARNPYQAKENKLSSRKLDMALFAAYLCSCVVLAFPVMILPTAAAELTAGNSGTTVAGFVASVASIATFGAGVGKFVNGFICKWWGGRQSSFLYLIGMAACSIFLSKTSSSSVGLAMAGIEFFSSIQFTSMALVLTNHYEREPTKLTAGMTTVSFGSTFGMLAANAMGAALLHHCHWRSVTQVGAAIALVGAFIIHHYVKDFPTASVMSRSPKPQERLDVRGVISSLKHVLGSRLFWQAGIAHALAFLARTSDRLLSTFFQEATLLPRNVCGGLLACLAFGYIHGLTTGRKIAQAKNVNDKSRMLRKRYICAVLSAMCLALCANKRVTSLLRQQSNLILILAVALSSGAMTSFLAFQIYLLPPIVANTFGKNKPVCLSFLDGLGYFLASPIWATTSRIVSHPLLEPHGWSVAWTMLAMFFALSGGLMMRALPPVLHKQQTSEANAKDQQNESGSEISHLA